MKAPATRRWTNVLRKSALSCSSSSAGVLVADQYTLYVGRLPTSLGKIFLRCVIALGSNSMFTHPPVPGEGRYWTRFGVHEGYGPNTTPCC